VAGDINQSLAYFTKSNLDKNKYEIMGMGVGNKSLCIVKRPGVFLMTFRDMIQEHLAPGGAIVVLV